MKKRLFALCLSVVMLLGVLPVTAGAANVTSGTCGRNITWDFRNNVLFVTGTGATYDYDFGNTAWYSLETTNIMTIRISEGVTHIGYMCFNSIRAKYLIIPSSVTSIDAVAFNDSFETVIYYGGSKNQWNQINRVPFKNAKIIFNSDGAEAIPPKTGWFQSEGEWYYSENDVRAIGWKQINGVWYYFNEEPCSYYDQEAKESILKGEKYAMRTGWLNSKFLSLWSDESNTYTDSYYLQSSGAMAAGWTEIDGSWYYFDGSGKLQRGWFNDGGTWYYLNNKGKMATGWNKVAGTWYYFSSSGAMQTGWLNLGGTWYYLYDSGAMHTGWLSSGGIWYHMDESGAMATGWRQVGRAWYYFNGSGVNLTGWLNDGGTWYYLNSDGSMATGTQTIDGITYTFDASGVWVA